MVTLTKIHFQKKENKSKKSSTWGGDGEEGVPTTHDNCPTFLFFFFVNPSPLKHAFDQNEVMTVDKKR